MTIKRVLALILAAAITLSLCGCSGAESDLNAAGRRLSKEPYKVVTKISFYSADPACAELLSRLGGSNFPLTVDGDKVMASGRTTEGGKDIFLTLCMIDDVLYYTALADGLTHRFLVPLGEEERAELDEKYRSREEITYSDFTTVEYLNDSDRNVIVCSELEEKKLDAAFGQVLVATAPVRDFDTVRLLGANMRCVLRDGRFRFVTTVYRFSIEIEKGVVCEAEMITEQAYTYEGVSPINIPDDYYLYDEVSYAELFGE